MISHGHQSTSRRVAQRTPTATQRTSLSLLLVTRLNQADTARTKFLGEESMATVASRVRTTAAVVAAAAVPLIIVVALGNQALQGWRDARAGSSNHWIADLFQPLTLAAWRFTPGSGPHSTAHWAAPLVFNVALVVITALLASLAAHNRGSVALLFGIWGATTLAGAAAGLISTPFAYSGVTGVATADSYRDSLAEGMLLGFLVGIIAAIVATAFAGGGSSGRSTNAMTATATQPTRSIDETWPLSS